eukprot:TRINITY_DN5956_c0_g1_i5.p1 TRINITY_DN5956_c0_g1~~TRINITY_DN5956_c0_g1_i5.p1  ORF type:complete len:402 (-),score=99.77 TRINITY_DN5956_c0_g1_i5:1353-2558(-)
MCLNVCEKVGIIMEYIYIAMILQELEKEINEQNVQKVFEALDLEADDNKIRLIIPALEMLSKKNIKKEERKSKFSTLNKLVNLEDKLKAVENSIKEADEKIGQFKKNEETENFVEFEHIETIEDKNTVEKTTYADEFIGEKSAIYVYGIGDKGVHESFGKIGIEGAEVYTIPYKDMCIVVHNCSAEPYKSEDDDVVKNWLFTQQEVLDAIWGKFGVVLPMSFDMIIEGKNEKNAKDELEVWMEENYNDFYKKVTKLKNKQEYGVQVMLNTEILSEKLLETDEKLKIKKKEIDAKPQGIAYMEKELLKDLIKEKIEEIADIYFKEFYGMIKKCTEDIVIGKTKKVEKNTQMIMNLSCLVSTDKVVELGEELEKMENKDGVSVRFSGPWAPFSFVTPEKRGEE